MPILYRSGWLCALAMLLPITGAAESPPRSTEALAFNCYTCHAPQVRRGKGDISSLKGKSAATLLQKLRDFKNGAGDATLMSRIARGYSDEELARIAEFLADDLRAQDRKGR